MDSSLIQAPQALFPCSFSSTVRVQAEGRLHRVLGGAAINGGRFGFGSRRAADRQRQAKFMGHSEATVISAIMATASVRCMKIARHDDGGCVEDGRQERDQAGVDVCDKSQDKKVAASVTRSTPVHESATSANSVPPSAHHLCCAPELLTFITSICSMPWIQIKRQRERSHDLRDSLHSSISSTIPHFQHLFCVLYIVPPPIESISSDGTSSESTLPVCCDCLRCF